MFVSLLISVLIFGFLSLSNATFLSVVGFSGHPPGADFDGKRFHLEDYWGAV